MIRIKDSVASLKFYQEVMGMQLLRTNANDANGFTLYFLAYPSSKTVPENESSKNGVSPTADFEGLLELTWNHGTENDAGFKYHNGNDEPQGFGHICKSYNAILILWNWNESR